MSGPLAIATVTAVIKDLLNDGLVNSDLGAVVGSVKVSALPPDRIATGAAEPSQINVFLYEVTGNAGWRNVDMPSRSTNGSNTLTSPPLALDLHYLVTAYGAADLDAEVLLGYAMHLLHETPVLSRDMIRRTFSVASPVTDKLLPESIVGRNPVDLADQVELCKITPRYLTTDELSRIWTAMQARYRPTMAYDVSVVMIQATKRTSSPLPVRRRVVRVDPIATPVLADVAPQSAVPGTDITLTGHNLKASNTLVRVGGELVFPAVDAITETAITVALPAGLPAGMQPIQVVHEAHIGDPPTRHPEVGVESNVLAFVLLPEITTSPPITAIRGAELRFEVQPSVGRDQRVAVLLGSIALPVPARAPSDPETDDTVRVVTPADMPIGDHLLRVQVDGAVSTLQVDTNQASETFNQYTGPKVTVT